MPMVPVLYGRHRDDFFVSTLRLKAAVAQLEERSADDNGLDNEVLNGIEPPHQTSPEEPGEEVRDRL